MGYNSWTDKDWKRIIRRLRKGIFKPFLTKIYQPIFRLIGNDGIDVVEKKWDILIILDACRYDVFEEVNWLDGDLEKVRSKGSKTYEWLNKNFADYYDDIVYVTANGFISPYKDDGSGFDSDEHFFKTVPVYLDDEAQEKGVTRPEAVTAAAEKAVKEHPEKRIIVHYVQPHDPYIGEPSISLEQGDIEDPLEYPLQENSWEAYKANLERVLKSVEGFLTDLDGCVVITSDHGEAFGEGVS